MNKSRSKNNKSKPNPRSIPRSLADVNKAHEQGMLFGSEFALNIVLYVLKDKHNASDEDIMQLRDEFMYQIDAISQGYLKYQDVQKILHSEYDLSVKLTDTAAVPRNFHTKV